MHFDVRVLCHEAVAQSPRRYRKNRLLLRPSVVETTEDTPQNPPAESFRQYYSRGEKSGKKLYASCLGFLKRQLDELIANDWRPDVIHGHSIFGAGVYAQELAAHVGCKAMVTENDRFNLLRLPEYVQHKALDCLRGVDALAAVSEHLARSLHAHDIERHVHVIGNFVDGDEFTLAKMPDGERYKLLFVGYPMFIKGPNVFLDALQRLPPEVAERTDVTIVSADNDYVEIYDSLISKRQFHTRISVLGLVSRADMVKLMQGSHVLVASSYAETFGLSIREAFACGRPVVTTDCGGIGREIGPKLGRVSPIGDSRSLAENVALVLRNLHQYDPMHIRQVTLERHGKTRFLERQTAIYRDILSA